MKKSRRKKEAAREYVVIGLGRFGSSVARQLELNGCEVLAIDKDSGRVQQIAGDVTYALTGDVTKEETLAELGMRNFDGAIIAMASSLEASVLTTIWAKEQGVPFVMTKAYSALQEKILKRVGADAVVFPESEMGVHIANNLAYGELFDTIEVTDEYSIIDLKVPESWVGRSLVELNLRKRFGINVIGLKIGSELNMLPEAERPLAAEEKLVVIGRNDMLKKLMEKQGLQ